MAITIQHNPGTYASLHGDIIFTVCDIVKASNPVTYPDYRYICDVYVDSVLVASLKSYPNPTNKCGVFNVGNILRAYVEANFSPTASTIFAQEMGSGEFKIAAVMKFGEEYNFTTYTNITVDSSRTYFNHYDGRLLGVSSNLSAIVDMPVTARTAHTSLTATSEGYPVYSSTTNHFVPFVHSTSGSYTLRIKSYTDAGTEINSQDVTINPAAANNVQIHNLSPTCINAAYPGLIPLTVASYYTVQFITSNILLDRILKFNLVCEPKYEVFTLHFLNRYGGFESRDFTKVSRKVIDIERSEYGKLGYAMDSSGVITYKDSNNVYNERRAVFSTGYKEKMTLNTDILSDSEYNWLADLILSPMVYVEISSGGVIYHVPCVITANNYEFRKRINDKLTNLELTIEFGENFNAQFR